MKRLEGEGLLDHPHTSAGRVPTEAGYRYYVDSLMEPEPITPATRRVLDKALDCRAPAAEDLQGLATRVLAKSSGQLAMVAVRPWAEVPIQSLDLVALEEGVLLLAIGERGSSTTWRPSRAADAATIRLAQRWIAERLPLRDPAACAALARAARREAPAAAVPLIAEVLHRAGKLLESQRRPDVRIGGAENIASQPEFQSADRLRGLVALLAEPEPLTRAMDAFMGVGAARVTIGRELGEGAMRACSLVGTGIASSRFHGSLGVLGPVRMPYPRLLSLVSYVGGRLAEFA
jgi:heat-inducible transcriptional repressor